MNDRKKNATHPFLRVVSEPGAAPQYPPDALEVGFQFGLFPKIDPTVISFFHVAFFKKGNFTRVIGDLMPSLVFDVRATPSFRPLALDRSNALIFLEERNANYVDVAGLLGGVRLRLAQSSVVGSFIAKLICTTKLAGPAVLLFDNLELMKILAEQIPDLLRRGCGRTYNAQVFAGLRAFG